MSDAFTSDTCKDGSQWRNQSSDASSISPNQFNNLFNPINPTLSHVDWQDSSRNSWFIFFFHHIACCITLTATHFPPFVPLGIETWGWRNMDCRFLWSSFSLYFTALTAFSFSRSMSHCLFVTGCISSVHVDQMGLCSANAVLQPYSEPDTQTMTGH